MKRPMTVLTAICCAVFAVADEPTGDVTLGDYSYAARLDLENRVRKALREDREAGTVAGTVTYSTSGFFFIQGKEEALKIFVEKGALPRSGDVIEAKGRPAMEGGRVVLVAESWRKTGAAELPSPRPVSSRELLFVGESERARKKDVNWLLVDVKGRAVALTESGFAIEVDGLPVTVAVDETPDFISNCEKTHPLVRVKGVAELILDQSTLFGRSRQVMGVKLGVKSSDDIVLVPDAVYLVNCRDRRVMILVGALIVLLIVGLLVLICFSIRQAPPRLIVGL